MKTFNKSKNKQFSNSLVFQVIKYSDENVIEKIRKMEDLNKNNISKNGLKKIAYMSLIL